MSTIAFLHPDTALPKTAPRKPVAACTLESDGIITELVSFYELTLLKASWTDLIARALEPNVFLEPSFAIPLFLHCGGGKSVRFLLTWAQAEANSPHRLIGLLPVSFPNRFLSCFARSPAHPLAPLGTPLFDSERGSDALRHMMQWFREYHPGVRGFIFSLIPKDGRFFTILQRQAEASEDKLRVFREHKRAILSKAIGSDGFPKRFISTKRRNNYRQQRRQLNRNGDVTYRTITSAAEIRSAAEAFLSLEFKGWKGLRRTALLAMSSETTFFRAMTRLMALESKCHIHTLDLGDKPIAMGVILESGNTNFYWKTTYDEQFARFSPGVQLTLELTQTQLTTPSVALTDSCAISNHPMIDHIWREHITMANVFLPISRAHGPCFMIGVWREIAYHSLRSGAKFVVKRIMRRAVTDRVRIAD
jgi:CelD/BcsL family acetyltransferase involved in cellulose biosynthesis